MNLQDTDREGMKTSCERMKRKMEEDGERVEALMKKVKNG